MLAIVSVQFVNPNAENLPDFKTEMLAFGWKQHPQVQDVLYAEFPDSACHEDIISTAYSEVGMCCRVVSADSWAASVVITNLPAAPITLKWD